MMLVNTLMIVIPALVFGYVYGRTTLRMELRIGKGYRRLHAMRKKLIVREVLPPAHDERNWCRNVHGEPSRPEYVLATTGCELTDAIFGAAIRADIVPNDFLNELEQKEQENGNQSNEE